MFVENEVRAMGMPYQGPEGIRKLVFRDVKLVEEYARILMYVDEDGVLNGTYKKSDGEYKLNVVAVIGPATIQEIFFEKVLLCEIGIGPSRPYHAAKIPRANGSTVGVSISKRRCWNLVDMARAKNIMPTLAKLLIDLTLKKVASWGPSGRRQRYITRSPVLSRKRKLRGITYTISTREYRNGVRYSIATKDAELLKIFCLFDVSRLQKRIEGIARMIGFCLQKYPLWNYPIDKLKLDASGRKKEGKLCLLIESLSARKKGRRGRVPEHHFAWMTVRGLISRDLWMAFRQCCAIFGFADISMLDFYLGILPKTLALPERIFRNADVWIPPQTKPPKRMGQHDFVVIEIIPADGMPEWQTGCAGKEWQIKTRTWRESDGVEDGGDAESSLLDIHGKPIPF